MEADNCVVKTQECQVQQTGRKGQRRVIRTAQPCQGRCFGYVTRGAPWKRILFPPIRPMSFMLHERMKALARSFLEGCESLVNPENQFIRILSWKLIFLLKISKTIIRNVLSAILMMFKIDQLSQIVNVHSLFPQTPVINTTAAARRVQKLTLVPTIRRPSRVQFSFVTIRATCEKNFVV